jgi:hypothetical protein
MHIATISSTTRLVASRFVQAAFIFCRPFEAPHRGYPDSPSHSEMDEGGALEDGERLETEQVWGNEDGAGEDIYESRHLSARDAESVRSDGSARNVPICFPVSD